MTQALGDIARRIATGPTLAYAILVVALILAPRIAELLRLPAMVGLVLAGMALGPHGTGLLASKQIALSALGEFGLLYLMFSAGLELNLKLLVKMKRVAITFAALSFAIPFTLGIVSAWLLGYKAAAAVLMGSNWGSHTLVTYPLLRQMGLSRNRAVATVVGATAVTDTAALLVLSVVSGTVKPTGSLGVQLLEIAVGLVGLTVWSLLGLPRLARWFFGRVGTDRSYRFIFGVAAFLVGGVLAEAAGIDAIVGAFFAGLGLNRAVPEQSPLMDRLQFMGSTLFVPIFLEMSWIEAPDPVEWLTRDLAETDLPLFVGADGARDALQRIPALAQGRFLVAVGAHESAPHEEKQPVSGPVIVGRSLKPRSA